jgi:hypothetical protein
LVTGLPRNIGSAFGYSSRNFGAEQKNLRGIIRPEQDQEESTGGAVGRTRRGCSKVPANQGFANCEQQGRDKAASNDVTPWDDGVRQNLEYRGKEDRKEDYRLSNSKY